ncbi:MAG: hypothetical protein JWM99_4827, partial [Verrucomicrobiales bacterium]|nr:hypothetical protein [Verrucomicrobiales bacterium]
WKLAKMIKTNIHFNFEPSALSFINFKLTAADTGFLAD